MNNEIYDFYNNGAEIGRLERGLGKVEFLRTKEILARYIDTGKVIYDIGGGIGMYAAWLAKRGNEVHLIELAESAVEYAKANMMQDCRFIAETGDARHIDRPDESADVVLLMGPQYHLRDRADRMLSLRESFRVLKEGGLLVAAGISKFSSMTWALSVYGEKKNENLVEFLDGPAFFNMIKGEMTTGDHIRPKEYPKFIAESYFTTAEEMKTEIIEAGFAVEKAIAVEGCIWFTPHREEKWEDEVSRERLLDIVRMTESEPEMMGMSPHFLVVARK
jgi:ubiquinone/menaquinone biosynthesis C-methylase UbiE